MSGMTGRHEIIGEVEVQDVVVKVVTREQAGIIVEHLLTANYRCLHTEIRRDTVDSNKGCRIACLQ